MEAPEVRVVADLVLSTLNYNGPDSSDYNENYTLKKTEKDNPWEDLIEACDHLNNLPINDLYDELKYYLDIDRALWFLAQEIVFSDDDSYIHKGGMDYYVYWDHATDRIIPLEVDGNSVMVNSHVTWNPFYHENDNRFPLLNRLLQNNEVRQRYLAHLRTVLEEHFVEEAVHDRIDEFAAILDQRVQDDPKKIYTYNQFINGVESLKGFVSTRINFLSNNNQINRQGVELSNLVMESANGVNTPPMPNEPVQVTVEVGADEQTVMLYYGLGLDGVFERVEMYDDGMHNDQAAGDNIYGADIPGFFSGNYVRYYVEAIKNDNNGTASYLPKGAEHDVFIYQVEQASMSSENVVINEFMADNDNVVADNGGDYDDWIELYNKGTEAINLTGYFMSDDEGDITKWQFPDNTIIAPNDYLIIWADEDEDQITSEDLHADFKLSAGGEIVILVNANEEIIDQIAFEEQETDIAFARIPNGTGDFQTNTPTFNANNEGGPTDVEEFNELADLIIYPNPASTELRLDLNTTSTANFELLIVNSTGQQMISKQFDASNFPASIDVSRLENGIYFISIRNFNKGYTFNQKLSIIR